MTVSLCRIEAGIACIDDERSRLRAERQAFHQFRKAVRSIQPATGEKVASSPQAVAVQTQAASTKNLLETYRETVMATDHYDSHYGESLEESLREEFTPQIARALRTTDRVTPLLHRKLFAAVNNCIERRSNLLEMLKDERESLRSVRSELRDVSEQLAGIPDCRLTMLSFDELEANWRQLDELERRCDNLLERRQWFITKARADSIEIDDPTVINEFLYQSMDSYYPAFKAILDVLGRIEERRIGHNGSVHDRSDQRRDDDRSSPKIADDLREVSAESAD